MGHDPFTEAGTYHQPDPTPKQKAAHDLIVKNFSTLFDSETKNIPPPTVRDWIPAMDVLSQAIADAATDPKHQHHGLVVTYAVYQRDVRQWLVNETRKKVAQKMQPQQQKSQIEIEYVVLHDVQGNAPKRKLQQIKAAAAAENKTMSEFLAKFGFTKYPGDDAMLASNRRVQNGFEPGVESKGEIGIEVTVGIDTNTVFEMAAKRLGLKEQ